MNLKSLINSIKIEIIKNSMSKTLLNEYINLGGAVILNEEVENLYRKMINGHCK